MKMDCITEQFKTTNEIINSIIRLENRMDENPVVFNMTKSEREQLTKTIELLSDYQSMLMRRYESVTGCKMFGTVTEFNNKEG